MLELAVALMFVGIVFCFIDLRTGMYTTVIVGFLQDPLRKLVADEPVYVTAFVIAFAVVTFVGAQTRNSLIRFDSIPDWNRQMRGSIGIFVLMVVIQSMASVVYTGSIVLAGIGLLAYLSPFPALMMSSSFATSTERITEFLWLYVIACALMCSGIYLSWLGVDWTLLNTVGEPLTVYVEQTGEARDLPAGFFRAPEVAAWHAAAGFCLSVILCVSSRRVSGTWTTGALALFFLGAVVLTGRRKFIVETMIFLPFFLVLLMRFKAGSARLIWSMSGLTLVGAIGLYAGLITSETSTSLAEVSSRSEELEIFDALRERFVNMTTGSLGYVLDANGFFGSGAGSGSQGAQYFGGGDQLVGYAAEGGIGKIMAEVGVPGVIIALWLALNFIAYVWRSLGELKGASRHLKYLAIGLAAFLASNSIVFMSAHQAFGDFFVLLLIGTCFGFIVATRGFVHEGLESVALDLYQRGAADLTERRAVLRNPR